METLMWCDTTWNKSIFTTFENFDTLLEIYLWILLQLLRFKGYRLSAEIILSNISLINSEVALQSVFKLRFYDASVCFQAKVQKCRMVLRPDWDGWDGDILTLPKTERQGGQTPRLLENCVSRQVRKVSFFAQFGIQAETRCRGPPALSILAASDISIWF